MADYDLPGIGGMVHTHPSSSSSSATGPTITVGANPRGSNTWLPWLQAISDVGVSAYGVAQTERANRRNIQLNREQRAWEEMMSNTAVQRRAADIEKAGGNRALAFTGGQDASTPSVTAPTVQAPDLGPARGSINSALQLAQMQATTQLTRAQTSLTRTQALSEAERAANTRASTNVMLTSARKGEEEIRNLRAVNREIEQRIENMVSENALRKIQVWIAGQTREDAIRQIRSGAILQELNIPGKELSAGWAKVKAAMIEALIATTPASRGEPGSVRYGPAP